MTSGGLGTLRPRYTNRMVGRPMASRGGLESTNGRDDPGGGTRAPARVLLHGHAVLRRAVLPGGPGPLLPSHAPALPAPFREPTPPTAPALARPDRGRPLQNFVFQVTIAGRTATLMLRPSFITAEFFELAGKAERDHAEEAHLDEMKSQSAHRILAATAEDVYELA